MKNSLLERRNNNQVIFFAEYSLAISERIDVTNSFRNSNDIKNENSNSTKLENNPSG